MDIAISTDRQYRYGRVEYKFERNLDGVQGREIARNAAKQATAAEIQRLSAIDLRVKAAMFAEAHDRKGQSMALAAELRKKMVSASRAEINRLRMQARDFDERTFELFRLGWLDKRIQPCADFLTRTIDARLAELDAVNQKQVTRMTRLASRTLEGSLYAF